MKEPELDTLPHHDRAGILHRTTSSWLRTGYLGPIPKCTYMNVCAKVTIPVNVPPPYVKRANLIVSFTASVSPSFKATRIMPCQHLSSISPNPNTNPKPNPPLTLPNPTPNPTLVLNEG